MSKEECRFCGRTSTFPCRNTRDMKDVGHVGLCACYAALLFHGGGEYTEDRRLAQELMRRAGLKRETGS